MKVMRVLPIFALIVAPLLHAQPGGMSGVDTKGAGKSQAKSHHATGVVKSVDAAKGIVTIDHEAINSMNWPAMTMTFKARNKAVLHKIKPGEKVDFTLVQSGEEYTVTRIKPRK